MAITKKTRVQFRFENSNGVLYDVEFVHDTGVGFARKHAVGITHDSPRHDVTETALTVDSADLTAWKSYHRFSRISKRLLSYQSHISRSQRRDGELNLDCALKGHYGAPADTDSLGFISFQFYCDFDDAWSPHCFALLCLERENSVGSGGESVVDQVRS